MKLSVRILLALGVVVAIAGLYVLGARLHLYGEHEGAGTPQGKPRPEAVVRARAQGRAARRRRAHDDAARQADPVRRPPRPHHLLDRCVPVEPADGAAARARIRCPTPATSRATARRSTSGRSTTTPRRRRRGAGRRRARRSASATPWPATRRIPTSWRSSAGNGARSGITPETHYGHKNVILRDLDDAQVPVARDRRRRPRHRRAARRSSAACPGTSRSSISRTASATSTSSSSWTKCARCRPAPRACPRSELPADCYESAATPKDLFRQARRVGHRRDRDPARQHLGLLHAAGSDLGQAARERQTRIRAASS